MSVGCYVVVHDDIEHYSIALKTIRGKGLVD